METDSNQSLSRFLVYLMVSISLDLGHNTRPKVHPLYHEERHGNVEYEEVQDYLLNCRS